jgi:hypothetical protein
MGSHKRRLGLIDLGFSKVGPKSEITRLWVVRSGAVALEDCKSKQAPPTAANDREGASSVRQPALAYAHMIPDSELQYSAYRDTSAEHTVYGHRRRRTNERKSHAKRTSPISPRAHTKAHRAKRHARVRGGWCSHPNNNKIRLRLLATEPKKTYPQLRTLLRPPTRKKQKWRSEQFPSLFYSSASKKRRRRRTADIDRPIRSRWCDGLSRIRINNKGSDEWEGPERREPRVRTHEAGWTKDTQKVKKTNGRPRRHFDAPDDDAIRSW